MTGDSQAPSSVAKAEIGSFSPTALSQVPPGSDRHPAFFDKSGYARCPWLIKSILLKTSRSVRGSGNSATRQLNGCLHALVDASSPLKNVLTAGNFPVSQHESCAKAKSMEHHGMDVSETESFVDASEAEVCSAGTILAFLLAERSSGLPAAERFGRPRSESAGDCRKHLPTTDRR